MKPHHCACWAALTGVSDTAPRSVGEVRALQLRVWRDCGLMVLSGEDERLTDEDRSDLHRIGERLFRERRSHPCPRRPVDAGPSISTHNKTES